MEPCTDTRNDHRLTASLDAPADGHTNMAKDVELLARAEQGGVHVRVYSWDGAWVSLGRFQNPQRALVDPEFVPWVSRPTGGKAVLHGHDVTVTIAANLAGLGLTEVEARSVGAAYRKIVVPLASALSASGLLAMLAERTPFVKKEGHTADCFAYTSPNDVVDPATGEKVCGCALRLTQDAVLLQSSIPVGRPLVEPSRVFDAPSVPGRERTLDETTLLNELVRAFDRSDIMVPSGV